MAYIPHMYIIPFSGFTQFTGSLPSFYWDVYSSEQRIKHLCCELKKVTEYLDYLTEIMNQYADDVAELREEFDKFIEGGFEEYYEALLEAWINEHMEDIISKSMKMVWFGLTLDGYFVAYIPDTWDDIEFDTFMQDYDDEKYGRLILLYDVDSPHNVEQP